MEDQFQLAILYIAIAKAGYEMNQYNLKMFGNQVPLPLFEGFNPPPSGQFPIIPENDPFSSLMDFTLGNTESSIFGDKKKSGVNTNIVSKGSQKLEVKVGEIKVEQSNASSNGANLLQLLPSNLNVMGSKQQEEEEEFDEFQEANQEEQFSNNKDLILNVNAQSNFMPNIPLQEQKKKEEPIAPLDKIDIFFSKNLLDFSLKQQPKQPKQPKQQKIQPPKPVSIQTPPLNLIQQSQNTCIQTLPQPIPNSRLPPLQIPKPSEAKKTQLTSRMDLLAAAFQDLDLQLPIQNPPQTQQQKTGKAQKTQKIQKTQSPQLKTNNDDLQMQFGEFQQAQQQNEQKQQQKQNNPPSAESKKSQNLDSASLTNLQQSFTDHQIPNIPTLANNNLLSSLKKQESSKTESEREDIVSNFKIQQPPLMSDDASSSPSVSLSDKKKERLQNQFVVSTSQDSSRTAQSVITNPPQPTTLSLFEAFNDLGGENKAAPVISAAWQAFETKKSDSAIAKQNCAKESLLGEQEKEEKDSKPSLNLFDIGKKVQSKNQQEEEEFDFDDFQQVPQDEEHNQQQTDQLKQQSKQPAPSQQPSQQPKPKVNIQDFTQKKLLNNFLSQFKIEPDCSQPKAQNQSLQEAVAQDFQEGYITRRRQQQKDNKTQNKFQRFKPHILNKPIFQLNKQSQEDMLSLAQYLFKSGCFVLSKKTRHFSHLAIDIEYKKEEKKKAMENDELQKAIQLRQQIKSIQKLLKHDTLLEQAYSMMNEGKEEWIWDEFSKNIHDCNVLIQKYQEDDYSVAFLDHLNNYADQLDGIIERMQQQQYHALIKKFTQRVFYFQGLKQLSLPKVIDKCNLLSSGLIQQIQTIKQKIGNEIQILAEIEDQQIRNRVLQLFLNATKFGTFIQGLRTLSNLRDYLFRDLTSLNEIIESSYSIELQGILQGLGDLRTEFEQIESLIYTINDYRIQPSTTLDIQIRCRHKLVQYSEFNIFYALNETQDYQIKRVYEWRAFLKKLIEI